MLLFDVVAREASMSPTFKTNSISRKLSKWPLFLVFLASIFFASHAIANEGYSESLKALRAGDTEAALSILIELSDNGHVGAKTQLGTLYELGRVVEKDESTAFKLYSEAAEKGGIVAQHKLARLYEDGRGTEQNHVLARKWYENSEKAAEAEGLARGASFSQYRLALIFLSGASGIADPVQAFVMAQLATDNGHEEAQAFLVKLSEKLSQEQISAAKQILSERESNQTIYLD
jgi:TPR repeat protein